MDLVRIGKFIAELRKELNLTQAQLADIIGVTNKTISRWETGTYLPPVEGLLQMSELFGVSMNELISGKRLSDKEYKKSAEENIAQVITESRFSLKDKIEFYKRKWLKEHIAIMILVGAVILGVLAIGVLSHNMILVGITPLLLALAHGWRNNRMMAYVENNAYSSTK